MASYNPNTQARALTHPKKKKEKEKQASKQVNKGQFKIVN